MVSNLRPTSHKPELWYHVRWTDLAKNRGASGSVDGTNGSYTFTSHYRYSGVSTFYVLSAYVFKKILIPCLIEQKIHALL